MLRVVLRRVSASVGCLIAVLVLGGCTPTHNWLVGAGGATQEDENDGISAERSGTVIVAGKFKGSATWSGTSRTAAGGEDMFVARYSRDGALLSVNAFGAAADDAIFDSTTDAADATYLSGWFGGTVDFGACATCDPVSAGGHDMVLVKQARGGQTQWVRRYGSATEDGGNEVETDADGNVYVLALSVGDFNDGTTIWANEGAHDSYVMKLRPDGTRVWTQKIAGRGRQRARGIEVTAGGAVLVTGEAFGQTVIGADTYLNPGDTYDVFTARLAGSDGRVLDSASYGTGGVVDYGRGIAGDPAGGSRVSGTFTGSIAFGGGVGVATAPGQTAAFAVRVDANGNPVWANSVRSNNSIQGGENVTDAAGNLYMTGDFSGNTTWSTTSGDPIAMSSSVAKAFVAKYDPAGKLIWVSAPSVTNNRTTGDELFLVPGGRLVVNGQVFGTVQYPGTAAYSAPSIMNKDMFVLSLNTG